MIIPEGHIFRELFGMRYIHRSQITGFIRREIVYTINRVPAPAQIAPAATQRQAPEQAEFAEIHPEEHNLTDEDFLTTEEEEDDTEDHGDHTDHEEAETQASDDETESPDTTPYSPSILME
jgi:hypothetical protein